MLLAIDLASGCRAAAEAQTMLVESLLRRRAQVVVRRYVEFLAATHRALHYLRICFIVNLWSSSTTTRGLIISCG